MKSTYDLLQLEATVGLLKNVPIFSEVGDADLENIAEQLTEVSYRRGQLIFTKGDEGDAMFIIKSGSVRVHDGNHVLSRLQAGRAFGEFALFDKDLRSASVTAEENTQLFQLSQAGFANVMADKVEVTNGVLKKVIRRIREMNELESKLAKSYMKIRRQKNEIETQHQNILAQKKELEKNNAELNRLNEEKNRLISVVSHGLRNPLTSSLCVADLIENEAIELNEDQKEYFNVVHNSLRRMNSLINQTLDIDIIELQRDKFKPEIVNMEALLRQMEDNFKYTLRLKKITFDVKLQSINIKADRNFLYLILDNLISNAIKFSPSNQSIGIDLFACGQKACIEISDQGPGMSDAALKTLFDNPRQHDRAIDKTGLSIAKKYVEAMGGKLDCKGKQGKGTTFRLEFDKN